MFDALKEIAPTLASALLNPVGTFAGLAVKTIGNALGLSDATKDGIAQALNNGLNPDQKLALQKEEHDFIIAVKQVANQSFQLEINDAASAREREVALSNSKWGWLSLSVQNFGALVIVLIMIVMTGWGLFYPNVDPQNQSQILNTNYNIILLLVGYWWGKSKKDNE